MHVIQNPAACLQPRARLRVTGSDAKTLLQGQLTCDLNSIAEGTSSLAAHCNASGKIISLFQVSKEGETWHLDMVPEMIPLTLAALQKYAVFYKQLRIDAAEDITLQAIDRLAEIRALFPAIYPETSGLFFCHELNLTALGAISFDKGCYTGQEIIARMHYRGKSKAGLLHAVLQSDRSPHRADDIFRSGHKPCGKIIDHVSPAPGYHEMLITAPIDCGDTIYLDGDCTLPLKHYAPGSIP